MSSTHALGSVCLSIARLALLALVIPVVSACSIDLDPGTANPPGAGNGVSVGPGGGDIDPEGAPMVDLGFTPTDALFPNPERGYYRSLNLVSGNPETIRSQGYSMAIAGVRLDDWRDSALPQSFLDQLNAGFARVRDSGIKVVLRFAYNSSFSEDASLSRILGHISQLTPALQDNADVIAVMQAGFIGAWGEWHSSTNGLDNDTDRRAVLDALLEALPDNRYIQVRTPMHVDGAFPGGTISPEQAFSGAARARIGHHNDCYLASDSDLGTYVSPIEQWRGYVADDSRFTPFGGETCGVYTARSACEPALAEMEMLHLSYINREYHPDVIADWVDGGCDDQISRRMGYRFVIDSASVSQMVAPGGILRLRIDLRNEGFAAPYNYRPAYAVIDDGSNRWTAKLFQVDARRWAPGQAITVEANLRMPADAAPGSYRVALRLPDAASTLRGDARHAIRMANQAVWDEWTGDNLLTDQLLVDADAPGDVDPDATGLVDLAGQ